MGAREGECKSMLRRGDVCVCMPLVRVHLLVRLRVRAPLEHAGKLSHVTVGGKAWGAFDAAEETIDISSEKITSTLIGGGDLSEIVAVFGGASVR